MMRSLSRLAHTFHAINLRYSSPRIGMSPRVRISLMALRLYLLFLVVLMLYKFVSLILA